MEPEVAASIEIERLDRALQGRSSEAEFQPLLTTQPVVPPLAGFDDHWVDAPLLAQVSQLATPAKLALINRLLTQLEPQHIQMVIESGVQTINDHQKRQTAIVSTVSPNTRLVLKKDYTYQDRGLTQPTQYYVYLRRCKPKLDRYIGTLFYVPQGCTLSYFLDTDGRIMFNPPYNTFQLSDYDDAANFKVVRLMGLEPPPIDYTFTKQQKDIPEIYLHLEFLDPQTHQAIAQEKLAFPACMHEGGRLDRYRWEVSTVLSPPDSLTGSPELTPAVIPAVLLPPSLPSKSHLDRFDEAVAALTEGESPEEPIFVNNQGDQPLVKPARRILELPKAKAPTFYLGDRDNSEIVLKRMRLWASWSEKAMPQAKWAVIQEGNQQILLNAHSQRPILKFSPDQAAITLENTLQVLMKWFHDLGLVVSQTQSHRRYSVTQLKLARNLFVDMSLPQTDPLHVLKKLFGVDFTEP